MRHDFCADGRRSFPTVSDFYRTIVLLGANVFFLYIAWRDGRPCSPAIHHQTLGLQPFVLPAGGKRLSYPEQARPFLSAGADRAHRRTHRLSFSLPGGARGPPVSLVGLA